MTASTRRWSSTRTTAPRPRTASRSTRASPTASCSTATSSSIPTPGHTPGATAFLWGRPTDSACCSPATRSTSATASGSPRSSRAPATATAYIESLELLRELEFDVLVPWAASGDALLRTYRSGRRPAAHRREPRVSCAWLRTRSWPAWRCTSCMVWAASISACPPVVFDDWLYNGVLVGAALICAARAVLVREERRRVGADQRRPARRGARRTSTTPRSWRSSTSRPTRRSAMLGWLLFYPAFWIAVRGPDAAADPRVPRQPVARRDRRRPRDGGVRRCAGAPADPRHEPAGRRRPPWPSTSPTRPATCC